MKENSKSIVFIVLEIISIILFVLGMGENNLNIAMFAILMSFVSVLTFSLYCGKKLVIFSAFLVCFFTFVLGKWGVNFIIGEPWGNEFGLPIVKHVLICIYLSLISIFVGSYIGVMSSKEKQERIDLTTYRNENKKFEGAVLVLMYITLVFSFIDTMITVIFVSQNSYLDLYTYEGPGTPYLIKKLAACNDFLFFAYIALLPEKKKAKTPIFLYFIVNAMTILAGGRGNAVKTAILVFSYCLFRNTTDEEKWVKKKHIIIVCILAPVAIVLLSLYNFWRSGASAQYYGFWNEFINFFTTQGGSIRLIAHEKQLHHILPETNISYTFGPIINWYKHGFLGNIINTITGQEFIKYGTNTIGEALYGNNLGATLTYLVMPYHFLSGIGMGTQYMAELYSDFGYAGVIIFNIFLGWVVTKCRFVYFKKWYWNAITIGVVSFFFEIGRDFATTFVAYYVSVANWLTVFLVYVLSRVKLKGFGGNKNENSLDM